MKINEIRVDRHRVHSERKISREMANCLSAELIDNITSDMAIKVCLEFPAILSESNSRREYFEVPLNWWYSFKQEVLPNCMKGKIKTKRLYYISEAKHYNVYPGVVELWDALSNNVGSIQYTTPTGSSPDKASPSPSSEEQS